MGGGLRGGGGGGGGGGGRGRRVVGWGSRGSAETPGGRLWRRCADRAGSSSPSALARSASEQPVLPRGASSSPGRRAMPIATVRDEPGKCRHRRAPGAAEEPAGPVLLAWSTCRRRPGCGPASSGAGSAPLGGCGTPPAAPGAVARRSASRARPRRASRALPAAVARPASWRLPGRAARRRGSLPAAVEKFGAPLRLPPSPSSPRDRCKHWLPRGGPRPAAAGLCRLGGSRDVPSGQGQPQAVSLAERTFSALLRKLSASSPSLRSKVELLFFKRSAWQVLRGAGDRGRAVVGSFSPWETETSWTSHCPPPPSWFIQVRA